MKNSVRHPATLWTAQGSTPQTMDLVGEEPLSIRVDGKPYSVVMRTPGDEIAHVAGFCLGEGIIDSVADASAIAFCDGESTNVVTVTLSADRRSRIGDILERRSYISQTSCGLCGKELVEDLHQLLQPVPTGPRMEIPRATSCIEAMEARQHLRRLTRASHAAALYDAEGGLLSLAEDIGRHNALDKAVGKAFLAETLGGAALLTLSSRVSYELVQKAARARIPFIVAVSRPTGLAVDLAERLNIGLACLAGDDGMIVFCGAERLAG